MSRHSKVLVRSVFIFASVSISLFCLHDFLPLGYDTPTTAALRFESIENTTEEQRSTTSTNLDTSDALDQLKNDPDGNTTSLHILLDFLKTHNPPERYGELITNATYEQERCASYGYAYTGRTHRRRLFYGSNVADDSWHALGSHAAEAYGLYHTLVLVESNVTHMRTPRSMRFVKDSPNIQAMTSGIWGPTTNVFLDHYYDDGRPLNREGDIYGLLQEDMQRELVLTRWIEQGMTSDDVGIVGDVDELFARDFLLAAMTCDVPQFRPGQDCKEPLLAGKTMVFESAPDCITEGRYWYHPDMLVGECIEGIGDSSAHPKAKRANGVGLRFKGYGRDGPEDYDQLPENTTKFPLFRPSDIRMLPGADRVEKDHTHGAFHLHNFFLSIKDIRHKYHTYTHGYDGDEQLKPLGSFQPDIDLAIRCMTNRDDSHLDNKRKKGGFASIVGPLPVAMQNEAYRKLRFEEMKQEILKDEEKYGVHQPEIEREGVDGVVK